MRIYDKGLQEFVQGEASRRHVRESAVVAEALTALRDGSGAGVAVSQAAPAERDEALVKAFEQQFGLRPKSAAWTSGGWAVFEVPFQPGDLSGGAVRRDGAGCRGRGDY